MWHIRQFRTSCERLLRAFFLVGDIAKHQSLQKVRGSTLWLSTTQQIFASRICFKLHSLKNVRAREAQFFVSRRNCAFVRFAVEIVCWVFTCSHTIIQPPAVREDL